MESKVQEYQTLYSKFEEAFDSAEKYQEPVEQLKAETKKLRQQQQQYDYTDTNIVIQYMESHIDSAIQEKAQDLRKEVKNQMQEITNTSDQVKRNFEKVTKWLSKKEVDKIVLPNELKFNQKIDMRETEKIEKFNIFSSVNKIFGGIFRFDFLVCFPKALRVIAAIIVWGIILVPRIVNSVYEKMALKNKSENSIAVDFAISSSATQRSFKKFKYELQEVVVPEIDFDSILN